MGLRIATNLASMAAARAVSGSTEAQAKTYERLASGQRILHAGDDAAGMSISENMNAQIRSLGQAERNANDGISFSQVAEGGLTEIGHTVTRLRELSVQAASDTIGDKERGYINQEVQQLVAEVDRIANVTNFNGTHLLNGKAEKGTLEFQVGIHNTQADRIEFKADENNVTASALGIDGLDYTSIDSARDAMDKVDSAMQRVFDARSRLGASQNKMHSTVNNIGIEKENLSAARSRIADADVAAETSELVRGNILQQAGIAVLAQANQAPTAALRLMG